MNSPSVAQVTATALLRGFIPMISGSRLRALCPSSRSLPSTLGNRSRFEPGRELTVYKIDTIDVDGKPEAQFKCLKRLVGERGFEPPTPWSRTRCSTRLSHSPTEVVPRYYYTLRDLARVGKVLRVGTDETNRQFFERASL